MCKQKNGKRYWRFLQSNFKDRKAFIKSCLNQIKIKQPLQKKKNIGIETKKAHDQFFYKTTPVEAIMGLDQYCIPSISKGKRYSFDFKLKTVRFARDFGIKPIARKFKLSKNTVKSWLNSYVKSGNQGLYDKRKGPKNHPNKIPKSLEKKIIRIRRKAPCFGPIRIKYFYDIPCSLGAIARVIKQNKLNGKRRLKQRKRNDLRKIKAKKHKSFEFLQMDIKYLTDIPFYVKQFKDKKNLPKYQYTVRDTISGMLFLGVSNEISELNARNMSLYVLSHLKKTGVQLDKVTVQTDNGAEFSGLAKYDRTALFVRHGVHALGAKHRYIRPGNKNAQADVETSHWMIEREFYDLCTHHSREDFLLNLEAYRMFFNLSRPNFSKNIKTPWLIAHENYPKNDICSRASLISTIDLDRVSKVLNKRGQTKPELAGTINKKK